MAAAPFINLNFGNQIIIQTLKHEAPFDFFKRINPLTKVSIKLRQCRWGRRCKRTPNCQFLHPGDLRNPFPPQMAPSPFSTKKAPLSKPKEDTLPVLPGLAAIALRSRDLLGFKRAPLKFLDVKAVKGPLPEKDEQKTS